MHIDIKMDFDPKKNYYEILWVWESATTDEIKKAFRKLAIKHHPDRGWSKEKFQEINEAYTVLSDDKKRQQYDAYRKGGFWWFEWGAWGFDFGNFGWFGGFSNWESVDFDIWDLLWGIFGWGFWWWTKVKKWEDLKKIIEISFDESYLWCEKKISYTRLKKVEWATEEVCSNCNGKWKVRQSVQTAFWVMQTSGACNVCKWVWKIFKKNWKTLDNWWLEEVKETIEIKIPAWIKEDAYIKYSGKWDAWIGDSPDWDLYLKIRIVSNGKYRREWDDLYVKVSVSLFDLVLWWEVEVPHPEWKVMVKIPKWTQIWDKIKISGRWFWEKWMFKSRWDLVVETEVSIPKKLTKEEESLWQKLRDWK